MNANATKVFWRVYFSNRAGDERTAERPTRFGMYRWIEAHEDDMREVVRVVKVTRR
jgi:hypothetical protein